MSPWNGGITFNVIHRKANFETIFEIIDDFMPTDILLPLTWSMSVCVLQDLSTMIRYRQNPIIFLINNGGYTIEVNSDPLQYLRKFCGFQTHLPMNARLNYN